MIPSLNIHYMPQKRLSAILRYKMVYSMPKIETSLHATQTIVSDFTIITSNNYTSNAQRTNYYNSYQNCLNSAWFAQQSINKINPINTINPINPINRINTNPTNFLQIPRWQNTVIFPTNNLRITRQGHVINNFNSSITEQSKRLTRFFSITDSQKRLTRFFQD